jgi:hypothetical protein
VRRDLLGVVEADRILAGLDVIADEIQSPFIHQYAHHRYEGLRALITKAARDEIHKRQGIRHRQRETRPLQGKNYTSDLKRWS